MEQMNKDCQITSEVSEGMKALYVSKKAIWEYYRASEGEKRKAKRECLDRLQETHDSLRRNLQSEVRLYEVALEILIDDAKKVEPSSAYNYVLKIIKIFRLCEKNGLSSTLVDNKQLMEILDGDGDNRISEGYFKNVRKVLGKFIKACEEKGIPVSKPSFKLVRKFIDKTPGTVHLTSDEDVSHLACQLWNSNDPKKMDAAIILILRRFFGARLGATAKFSIENIFFLDGEEDAAIFKDKGGELRGNRLIDIPQVLREILREAVENSHKEKRSKLFRVAKSAKLVNKLSRKYFSKMELQRPHHLRNNLATFESLKGTDLSNIAYKTGHTCLKTTQSVYDQSPPIIGLKNGCRCYFFNHTKAYLSISELSKCIGVSRQAIYNLQKSDPNPFPRYEVVGQRNRSKGESDIVISSEKASEYLWKESLTIFSRISDKELDELFE